MPCKCYRTSKLFCKMEKKSSDQRTRLQFRDFLQIGGFCQLSQFILIVQIKIDGINCLLIFMFSFSKKNVTLK